MITVKQLVLIVDHDKQFETTISHKPRSFHPVSAAIIKPAKSQQSLVERSRIQLFFSNYQLSNPSNPTIRNHTYPTNPLGIQLVGLLGIIRMISCSSSNPTDLYPLDSTATPDDLPGHGGRSHTIHRSGAEPGSTWGWGVRDHQR